MPEMSDELIARWGYLAVAIGTFIEGEAVLIAAGALAQKQGLDLPLLVSFAAAGSIAWSQLWFHTGRRAARLAIGLRPSWQARRAPFERFLLRHGRLFVLGFRWVAGMGTVCPALLGASGYAWRSFVLLDSAGAALWAAVFVGVGWSVAAGFAS
jgi:membrane protein DedA with SNARE-associated domain